MTPIESAERPTLTTARGPMTPAQTLLLRAAAKVGLTLPNSHPAHGAWAAVGRAVKLGRTYLSGVWAGGPLSPGAAAKIREWLGDIVVTDPTPKRSGRPSRECPDPSRLREPSLILAHDWIAGQATIARWRAERGIVVPRGPGKGRGGRPRKRVPGDV